MIKLVNDDCLNYLANVKDHSIDMILCDLPYGTTVQRINKEEENE